MVDAVFRLLFCAYLAATFKYFGLFFPATYQLLAFLWVTLKFRNHISLCNEGFLTCWISFFCNLESLSVKNLDNGKLRFMSKLNFNLLALPLLIYASILVFGGENGSIDQLDSNFTTIASNCSDICNATWSDACGNINLPNEHHEIFVGLLWTFWNLSMIEGILERLLRSFKIMPFWIIFEYL